MGQTWICPDCGRIFSRANQWHSCEEKNIDEHFYNKQGQLREVFDQIENMIKIFGPVNKRSVKSEILFAGGSNFLGIQVRKDHLMLEFKSREEIREFPVNKSSQLSAGIWLNQINIQQTTEIDNQLLNWLRKSYVISLGKA